MATTAIFAEILIAGLEALAWLALLVFGLHWDSSFHHRRVDFKDWEALTTLAVISVAYVFGILVDRAADSLHKGVRKLVKLALLHTSRSRQRFETVEERERRSEMTMTVLAAGGELAGFLEYQRSRARIARATALNAGLAALSVLVVWIASAHPPGSDRFGVELGLLATSLAALSEIVYVRIDKAHKKRLRDAYKVIVSRDHGSRHVAEI